MIREISPFSSKYLGSAKTDITALLFNGEPTGRTIHGYEIEKQFETDAYYLLITSSGWFCEQFYYITLLDKSFNLIDEKQTGCIYGHYYLKEATPESDNEMLLHYSNNDNDYFKKVQIKTIPCLPLKPYLHIKSIGGRQWLNIRCVFIVIGAFCLLTLEYPPSIALIIALTGIIFSLTICNVYSYLEAEDEEVNNTTQDKPDHIFSNTDRGEN